MSDPTLGGLLERHAALLERAAELERALEQLRDFGKRLMNSPIGAERGIGRCICDSTRVLDG